MGRYIDTGKITYMWQEYKDGEYTDGVTLQSIIDRVPTEDVVSKGLYNQIKWERDIALEQLADLGLCLGQKIEGYYVTEDEYDKLIEYKHMYEDLCK